MKRLLPASFICLLALCACQSKSHYGTINDAANELRDLDKVFDAIGERNIKDYRTLSLQDFPNPRMTEDSITLSVWEFQQIQNRLYEIHQRLDDARAEILKDENDYNE